MIFLIVFYTFKTFQNSFWMKIFDHNSTDNTYFSNLTHSLYSLDSKLYSLLNKIDDSYKINNKFEFLLEYPELNGFNWWRQSIFPLFDDETTSFSKGYEEIMITWRGRWWGGLVKSSANIYTLLDGSVNHGNWYYSIGCINNAGYNNLIPGPAFNNVDNIWISRVILWIRIPFLKSKNQYFSKEIFYFLIFQIFIL